MNITKTASIADMIKKSNEYKSLVDRFDIPEGTTIFNCGMDVFGRNTMSLRFANDNEIKIVEEDFEPIYYDEKGNPINKDGEPVEDAAESEKEDKKDDDKETDSGFEISIKNNKEDSGQVVNVSNVGDVNITIKIVSEK